MKKAKISELKSQLSRFLAYVRRGGVVRVYDRERAIADIVPTSQEAATPEEGEWLAELERAGTIIRGSGRLPEGFLTQELPRSKASVVEALLSEREDGR